MALQVRFGNNVESQLIGDVEKIRMMRLMSSPNRVDVGALHANQVRAHCLVWDCPARERVVFVAVHAIDNNRLSVDKEVRAAHLDTAEPNLLTDSAAIELDQDRIQVRCFGGPKLEVIALNSFGVVIRGRSRPLVKSVAAGRQNLDAHVSLFALHGDIRSQGTAIITIINFGDDLEVRNRGPRE